MREIDGAVSLLQSSLRLPKKMRLPFDPLISRDFRANAAPRKAQSSGSTESSLLLQPTRRPVSPSPCRCPTRLFTAR